VHAGHERVTRVLTWVRANAAILAIAAVGCVYLVPVQYLGWNQGAHYALVRALANGTPYVDKTRFEVGKGGMADDGTGDLSLIDGHYYAAKSPGLAFEVLPAYLLLKAAGGADAVRESRPKVWYLQLLGSLLPALVLLLLVARTADGLEPGYGAAAAVTLGLTTMLLPFATMLFSHALSTMLAFAAFAVLWQERRGPPRILWVGVAGLLSGLAVTTEFPVALVGAIVGLYAIARRPLIARLGAYAAGVVVGVLPALLFNLWAFGNMFTFSYANVVGDQEANKRGLFGVAEPDFGVLVQLLFSPIGLLVLTPVLLAGLAGLAFVYRRGHRLEALVAAAVVFLYLVMNSGYETPFGGNSPGPRFLVVTLPFLALGLAAAYRSFPLTTLGLAIGSGVEMVVLTLTNPLGTDDRAWFHRFATDQFVETVGDLIGIGHGVLLFFLALALAVALGVLATRRPAFRVVDAARAVLAVVAWIVLVKRAPHLLDDHGPWAALGLAESLVLAVVLLPIGLERALVLAAGRRGATLRARS
jgi:4-amino-4-deoxy-L-arabinose transferase-like glycosyltransferase